MIKYKITRFQKIKEDGILKSVVIGITASNGTKSAYIDWTADIKDIKLNKLGLIDKLNLLDYIKKYMTEAINQGEIDEANKRKTELETQLKELKKEDTTEIEKQLADLVIPEPQTRIKSLKSQLNAPVITRETDNSLVGEVLSL